MRRILLIVIMLVMGSTVFAQQTYEADFTQTRVMKVSGKTVNKAGHLVFDGKDYLSMIYSEPEGEFFIIDGNIVKINMDGKNVNLNADKAKSVELQRSTLLNCISGNWEQAAADNHAEVNIVEEEGQRTIFIYAKEQEKTPRGGYVAVILTYRNDGSLMTMVLEQKNGVINTYEIN